MDTIAIFFLFTTISLMFIIIFLVYELHVVTKSHDALHNKMIRYIRELEEQLNKKNE